MQTEIADPVASADRFTRREWLALPLLLIASALVLMLVYLQFFWQGSWISTPSALAWRGSSLNLTKGQGYKRDGILTIESLETQGEQSVAVASFSPKTFRAKDYAAVHWVIGGGQPAVQTAFLWRTVEHPGRINSRPLMIDKDGHAVLELEGDKGWDGQIMGLALIVKGQLEAPVAVKEFSLKPGSAAGALTKVIGNWFAPETWQGTSINFLNEDALDQKVPLVLASAALVFLTLLVYFVLARFGILRFNVVFIWGIFLFGWFALDARWQWNLLRQLDVTRQQFAGKPQDEKHRMADQGLFEFMHQVNSQLGTGKARILVYSDDAFSRGKGAYYLYPHNVMASHDVSAIAQLKVGEYGAMLGMKDVKYDDSSKSLIVNGMQPVKSDMLLSVAGNYLFKVR